MTKGMEMEWQRGGSEEAEAIASKATERFEIEYRSRMEKVVAAFWNYSIQNRKYSLIINLT